MSPPGRPEGESLSAHGRPKDKSFERQRYKVLR
jgi:hypothetical protein